MELDTTYRSAERWLWTSRIAFPDGFESFIYYIIIVCRVSLFIRIYPVRDKSAQTLITCALERMRVSVQMTHPDTHLLSIHVPSPNKATVKTKITSYQSEQRESRSSPDPHHVIARECAQDERA